MKAALDCSFPQRASIQTSQPKAGARLAPNWVALGLPLAQAY